VSGWDDVLGWESCEGNLIFCLYLLFFNFNTIQKSCTKLQSVKKSFLTFSSSRTRCPPPLPRNPLSPPLPASDITTPGRLPFLPRTRMQHFLLEYGVLHWNLSRHWVVDGACCTTVTGSPAVRGLAEGCADLTTCRYGTRMAPSAPPHLFLPSLATALALKRLGLLWNKGFSWGKHRIQFSIEIDHVASFGT
jgi:hypothetical protein